MSSCGAKAQQDPATFSPGHCTLRCRRIRDHRIETGHFPAFLFLHLRLRLLLISSDWSIRLPQDNLRRLFCNFTGKSRALPEMFGRFQYHAMNQGTAADAAVPADEKCMQFPGKCEAPVYGWVTGLFTPKNHPERHDSPGYGTAGTPRTPHTDGKPVCQFYDIVRVAKPELIVDGLDNRFRAVIPAGAMYSSAIFRILDGSGDVPGFAILQAGPDALTS